MQKPMNGRMHGMVDYATVATTAAAPRMLGFPRQAEKLAYGLAAGYLGLSLLTDYPLSARKAVPFKGHGATELLIGMALPFMPWLLGFSENRRARDFFLGLTALTAISAALTDWDAEDADQQHRDVNVRLNQARTAAGQRLGQETPEMATA